MKKSRFALSRYDFHIIFYISILYEEFLFIWPNISDHSNMLVLFLNLVSSIDSFYVIAALNFANEFDVTNLENNLTNHENNFAKHVFLLLLNLDIISSFLLIVVLVVVVIRYAKFFRSLRRPQCIYTGLTLERYVIDSVVQLVYF